MQPPATNLDGEFVGVDINPQHTAVVEKDVPVGEFDNVQAVPGDFGSLLMFTNFRDLRVRPWFPQLFSTISGLLAIEPREKFSVRTESGGGRMPQRDGQPVSEPAARRQIVEQACAASIKDTLPVLAQIGIVAKA